MKRFLIALALSAIAGPGLAQRVPNPVDKLPPEQQFLVYLKDQIKEDSSLQQARLTDYQMVVSGKSYCGALRNGKSYSWVRGYIGRSFDVAHQQLHNAILEQAMWSLCSDQMEKTRQARD